MAEVSSIACDSALVDLIKYRWQTVGLRLRTVYIEGEDVAREISDTRTDWKATVMYNIQRLTAFKQEGLDLQVYDVKRMIKTAFAYFTLILSPGRLAYPLSLLMSPSATVEGRPNILRGVDEYSPETIVSVIKLLHQCVPAALPLRMMVTYLNRNYLQVAIRTTVLQLDTDEIHGPDFAVHFGSSLFADIEAMRGRLTGCRRGWGCGVQGEGGWELKHEETSVKVKPSATTHI
ncbi:hypothetical protein EDD18DRAFT_1106874 [Armillaria luteobubalina]|uniref:Uncharacterized protein n=1 Tax=Armillaria luteobubalina TaxID=153913 RepID=A0AA39US58_9AGAR|nr:hypothetical protein EDD18DRAFT_1106874 [Armillaria luteobubalina]